MTTIPVGSLPQPTTPRSASQSPRLPLSPRAQQVLKNQAKPVPRLVPRVSVMPGAITPEAKSPRTQPASSSATPRSAAASAETTPRTTTPEPRAERGASCPSSGSPILQHDGRPLRRRPTARIARLPGERSRRSNCRQAQSTRAPRVIPWRRLALCAQIPCRRSKARDLWFPRSGNPTRGRQAPASLWGRRARDAFSRSMTQNCRLDGVRPSGLRWKRGQRQGAHKILRRARALNNDCCEATCPTYAHRTTRNDHNSKVATAPCSCGASFVRSRDPCPER